MFGNEKKKKVAKNPLCWKDFSRNKTDVSNMLIFANLLHSEFLMFAAGLISRICVFCIVNLDSTGRESLEVNRVK